ncbi:MAG TPA: alpha/beta hydrolase [Noviherbaspirillum sp.]|nr:alpha/beta hydrolase [Noviherbaspirillum sp.]
MTNSATTNVLTHRTLHRDGHEPLDYAIGGNGGEYLVIVNAYGQSLAFWDKLLVLLVTRYRVVIWQPRGTQQHGGQTAWYPVEQHVQDMRAVFDAENIGRAHILAWCTGPKTALAFQHACPDRVASMIFLTGCFIHARGYEHLVTRYEAGMLDLCRMIDQRPELATQLRDMFKAVLPVMRRAPAGTQNDHGAIAGLVTAPFATPESLLQYARQLLHFWDVGILPILANVTSPVLFIGAELDDVTHPELSRELARRVPGAVYAEVAHGSHYIHTEQPSLLHEMLADFTQGGRLRDASDRLANCGVSGCHA